PLAGVIINLACAAAALDSGCQRGPPPRQRDGASEQPALAAQQRVWPLCAGVKATAFREEQA
ncbi:hypothetical protein KL931_005399, partial [Ogataea haglerorum]